MIEGYTKEELEWKNTLTTERKRAFAELCVELSRKFEVDRNEVMGLVEKHFWDVWDTSSYVRGLVKETYPLRG